MSNVLSISSIARLNMAPPNIAILPATEVDAPSLAFSASDSAYPLIWGRDGLGDATHDAVALKGLFSPVQSEGQVTHVAIVDCEAERTVVGFARWMLPDPKAVGNGKREEEGWWGAGDSRRERGALGGEGGGAAGVLS